MLDPAAPLNRLRTIVAEAQPARIVVGRGQEEVARALAGPDATVLPLDALLAAATPEDVQFPALFPEMPAILLYTSGSTGTPKGVVLGHETVLHRVSRYTEDFRLGPEDRLTLLQSLAVSAGVRDLFGALLNGATLAIYDVRSRGIRALPDWLNRNRISVFYAVPTIWRLFLEVLTDETFTSIRAVRLGGEAVQPRDLEGFKAHFPPGCLLVNGYAATEADTICQYIMTHGSEIVAERLPVGTPVRGISVTLVDDTGHAVVGAVGEIVVEGATVASGSWDADRRQIVRAEVRRCAVGDLGYQLPDGRIFLTGRRDFIVKVHGHRIHLNEIEKAVSAVDGVRDVVAVSHTTPGGDVALVVYYVPTDGVEVPSEQLRRTGASVLPGPAPSISFIPLPGLPRLPGGKVNRNLLPQPAGIELQPPAEATEYHGPIEAGVARMWADVLGIATAPRDTDFFALGGDSVTAFRVLNRIGSGFNVEVSAPEFFAHSTVAGLARVIARELARRDGA
jgi:acyl-coenzyme A synthetase/AMP-(fatty) acid ligase